MAKKMDAIREQEFSIEIDAQKGEWPFVKAAWGEDTETGKRKLALIVDENNGRQFVGEGKGMAAIILSEKKVAALFAFLERTL